MRRLPRNGASGLAITYNPTQEKATGQGVVQGLAWLVLSSLADAWAHVDLISAVTYIWLLSQTNARAHGSRMRASAVHTKRPARSLESERKLHVSCALPLLVSRFG